LSKQFTDQTFVMAARFLRCDQRRIRELRDVLSLNNCSCGGKVGITVAGRRFLTCFIRSTRILDGFVVMGKLVVAARVAVQPKNWCAMKSGTAG
jgi:hypothetical protein